MATAAPISNDEFANQMQQLLHGTDSRRIAVAVSGGLDSSALVLLAAEWGDVVALTFDHGIRPESGSEARRIGEWLAELGVEHHVLTNATPLPETGLEAAARDARYRAMEAWCREKAIRHLLVAHTLEDQAETVILRLVRGSGVDGLAAMAEVSPPNTGGETPLIVRPLLGVARARLQSTICAKGHKVIVQDPMNLDRTFERVKVRELLRDTDITGLNAHRLADAARHQRRAREALEQATRELLGSIASIHFGGVVRLALEGLLAAPEELSLRALGQAIRCVSGRAYPLRIVQLERALLDLRSDGSRGFTLAGAAMSRDGDVLVLHRELARIAAPVSLPPDTAECWDGRFRIVNGSARTLSIGALGEEGWNLLVREHPHLRDSAIPHAVRLTLPAFRIEDEVIWVPGLFGDESKLQGVSVNFNPDTPLMPSGVLDSP